jgi:hypothetical protein
VEHSADKWSLHLARHTAFYGYRWFAWMLAALALVLPDRPAGTLPRDAAFVLLLLLMNVALTALAYPYTRIARRRWFVLGLDLLASAALLWLSDSAWLPFFPYAPGEPPPKASIRRRSRSPAPYRRPGSIRRGACCSISPPAPMSPSPKQSNTLPSASVATAA